MNVKKGAAQFSANNERIPPVPKNDTDNERISNKAVIPSSGTAGWGGRTGQTLLRDVLLRRHGQRLFVVSYRDRDRPSEGSRSQTSLADALREFVQEAALAAAENLRARQTAAAEEVGALSGQHAIEAPQEFQCRTES